MKKYWISHLQRLRIKIGGLLQIATVYAVLCWIFTGGIRLHMDRSAIKNLKPPFIVLGNHTSNFDPVFVQWALKFYPCYFLTTNFYFRHPFIGKLLRLFGAIPKVQFVPDQRSARQALALLIKGAVIGIFPEGRRSIDGSVGEISVATARFIKKAKVPVITVKINGGYFLWPRWSPFHRSGRAEITAKQLLSVQDICTLTTDQIHTLVCRNLSYNDYDWNLHARIRYMHRKAAEGLDLVLHQCPRCLGERKMRSWQNRLYCQDCGNAAVLDDYGFFRPEDDHCTVFEDPVQWVAWQRQHMLSRVKEENFCMQMAVKEIMIADPLHGSYRSCGSGQVSLYREGLYFHGKIDGQMTNLFFPIERLPTISTEFSYDFEICDNRNAWWIFLEDRQQTIRLESAITLLHRLKSC